MKDQKVFVGSASHQWNDPFTYAIGTTQAEVDDYLRESSIDDARNHLDACESEDCRIIAIRNWSEDMTVFEDYRGSEIPVNDNGNQIIKDSRPNEWIGDEFALFYVDMFSEDTWNQDRNYDYCNCYLAEDITFGSIETDDVEQILDCMDDDEVIKLGDLDRIAIGDAITYRHGWKVEGSFRNDEWIDGYIEIFETPKTERDARYAMLWKLIDAYYTEIDHAPDAVDYLQQKFDFVS